MIGSPPFLLTPWNAISHNPKSLGRKTITIPPSGASFFFGQPSTSHTEWFNEEMKSIPPCTATKASYKCRVVSGSARHFYASSVETLGFGSCWTEMIQKFHLEMNRWRLGPDLKAKKYSKNKLWWFCKFIMHVRCIPYIYIILYFTYEYLQPVCPLLWNFFHPPKQGSTSNQNKGHKRAPFVLFFCGEAAVTYFDPIHPWRY